MLVYLTGQLLRVYKNPRRCLAGLGRFGDNDWPGHHAPNQCCSDRNKKPILGRWPKQKRPAPLALPASTFRSTAKQPASLIEDLNAKCSPRATATSRRSHSTSPAGRVAAKRVRLRCRWQSHQSFSEKPLRRFAKRTITDRVPARLLCTSQHGCAIGSRLE